MHGAKILSGLLYHIMAFPRGFQDGLQITGKRSFLELLIGLQRLFTVTEWSVPGRRAPGLAVPRMVAPGLDVPRTGCSSLGFTLENFPMGSLSILSNKKSRAPSIGRYWALLSHTTAVLWPVVFLPSRTFHSLVLELSLNLSIVKVQDVGKFLHLLEAEVLLSLKICH